MRVKVCLANGWWRYAWCGIIFLLAPILSFGDDIEIFAHDEVVHPNILFSLDMSGSMNDTAPGKNPGKLSKKDVLKQTISDILNSGLKGVNIGLQDFSTTPANIRLPVEPVDTDASTVFAGQTYTYGYTTKTVPAFPSMPWAGFVNQTAQGLNAHGVTPMMGAYYEAARYMRGEMVGFGDKAPLDNNGNLNDFAAHPSTYVPQNAWQYGVTGTNVSQSCSKSWWIEDGSAAPTTPPDWDDCPSDATPSCNAQTYNPGYDYDCPTCDSVCSEWDATGSECIAWTDTNCVDKTCHANSYWSQSCSFTGDTHDWIKTVDPTYVSPIEQRCQESFIVLMTDGIPTKDDSRDEINSLTGDDTCPLDENQMESKLLSWKDENGAPWFKGGTSSTSYGGSIKYGACGPVLARFMANEDQCETSNGHCSIGGTDNEDQSIKTYTIGFDLAKFPEAKRYLELVAYAGDGKFYSADDASGLTTAINNAINDILARNSSFSSPAISVRSGPFQHDQWVYMPMFQTSYSPRWPGNVKKYQYKNGVFIDPDGKDVIDAKTGEFNGDVKDFWNAAGANDGNMVTDGGAASHLDSSRRLFTESGDGKAIVGIDSANVGATDFCGGSCAEPLDVDALKTFTKGYQSDGTPRKFIGDPLHTRLVTLNYAGNRQSLFFTTNEGYLHSVDTDSGAENYAFIPRELLKNQKTFYDNGEFVVNGKTVEHVYGLDGKMLIWHKDTNANNLVDSNEDAFMVVGMRRGGRDYYVLDISNPDQPKLKFKIVGGAGDFSRLGQTWSPPKIIKVRDAGKEKYVLLFGGGYDDHQDFDDKTGNDGVRESDSMGNAVYIVGLSGGDAGKLLKEFSWSDAGASKMLYSVPGGVGTASTLGNSIVDRLYFADTGGQVWRIDLDQNDLAKSKVKRLADLNGGTAAENRRFYAEPSIAVSSVEGKTYYHLSLGSGFRAHPLNKTIQDRFYSLVDDGSGTMITDSSLYDATSNLIGTDKSKTAQTEIYADKNGDGYPDKKGWYINLDASEKVLDPALTLNYKVIFTSYVPPEETVVKDVCTAGPSGGGYTYVINLMDATPAAAFLVANDASSLNAGRRIKNVLPGIIGKPVVMLTPQGTEVLAGREVIKDSSGKSVVTQEDYREEFWIDADK